MPNYNYECRKCQHIWEQFQSMADCELPTKKPCPKCKARKCVHKSWADCTPQVGVDHNITPDKMTGGRWSELMGRMKRTVPERLKHKFDTYNGMKGRKWH